VKEQRRQSQQPEGAIRIRAIITKWAAVNTTRSDHVDPTLTTLYIIEIKANHRRLHPAATMKFDHPKV
jgi:hypothetical protein